MDAIELLKKDHRVVKDLFEQVEDSQSIDQKRDLFELIKEELFSHIFVEESIFYPACDAYPDLKGRIQESFEEHREVKDYLEQIEGSEDDDEVERLLDELMDAVDHHINEEENLLFSKAQILFSKHEIENLGSRIESAKQKRPRAA